MKTAPIPTLSSQDIDRFWSHVNQQSNDLCWSWLIGTDPDGYGKFSIKTRSYRAHRVAYFLHYQVDPGDLLVCHTCDNPICCNPHHLFLGDNKVNINDARTKGRLNTASGEKHGTRTRPDRIARGEQRGSKLTEPQVREIRRLYRDEQWTQQQIADQYSVDRKTISEVIRGRNWRHIAEQEQIVSLSDASRKINHGSDNGQSKLTEDDVRNIRLQVKQGIPRAQLAQQYDVSVGLIGHIVRRIAWKHID